MSSSNGFIAPLTKAEELIKMFSARMKDFRDENGWGSLTLHYQAGEIVSLEVKRQHK